MFRYRLFVIAILVLLLAACGAKSAEESYKLVEMQAPPAMEVVVERELVSQASMDQSGDAMQRIVIKNASLDIIVAHVDQSMDAIGRMAEEMGGYVVSANLYQSRLENGVEVPRGSITIRVLAERLDETMARIAAESDQPVQNKNINSQDVTSEYTDLQSRLRNLEAAETQLTKIMDSATKTEDVLRVYNELSRVREQIEVIKGQMQYYEQSARLSSITVNLIPQEAVEPITIGRWQPVGVARDALQTLVDALKFLVNVGIWLALFVVPVLVVVVAPLYFIVRGVLRLRARRRARRQSSVSS